VTEFQSTLWTLIRGADRGDEAALREFALKYRAPVVAYIARRGLAREAEDLAQEVFVRLFEDRVLSKADPSRGRFRSLVLAVTRHVMGHHRERQGAQKRGGGYVRSLEGQDVALPEADEGFDREWVAHLLEVALSRLAREHPNYHDALRRFLLEGSSCAEIASALGKSEGDIHNYVRRGKAKLADYLRDEVRDYSATRDEYEEELRSLSRLFP
jgi:RNA polymerase sigma-70 factor (ECF subfamily)